MISGRRRAARAATDNSDPTHQQLGGEGSNESSSSRTINNNSENPNQPTNKPGENHSALPESVMRIDPQAAALMDPALLQRYYEGCARIQIRRIERELKQITKEEADDSGQFYASIGGIPYRPPGEPGVTPETGFRSGRPLSYYTKDEKEWRSFIN